MYNYANLGNLNLSETMSALKHGNHLSKLNEAVQILVCTVAMFQRYSTDLEGGGCCKEIMKCRKHALACREGFMILRSQLCGMESLCMDYPG